MQERECRLYARTETTLRHYRWKNARGPQGRKRFTKNVLVGLGKDMERRSGLLPPGGDLHQPI